MLLEKAALKVLRLIFLFGCSLFVFMTILTFVHVIGRYAFNEPIYGQTELVGLMQAAAISMTGAYVLIQKRHVAIGILVERFPARIKAVVEFFMYVLCLAFTSLVSWKTIEHAAFLLEKGQQTDLLHVPLALIYYVIGVGWGLISIAAIMLIVYSAIRIVKK